MTDADDLKLYRARIDELVAAHGEVPPLWAMFPRVHPLDIGWRMGAGEDYKYLLHAWTQTLDWGPDGRLAYARRWDPPPSWLQWVASFVWPDERDGYDVPDALFDRLQAEGFGSKADWLRCFDVEPEAYPLAEDRSARWLEEG